jgi:hypothetical protein
MNAIAFLHFLEICGVRGYMVALASAPVVPLPGKYILQAKVQFVKGIAAPCDKLDFRL